MCGSGTQPNACSKKLVRPATRKRRSVRSSSRSTASVQYCSSVSTMESGRCASTTTASSRSVAEEGIAASLPERTVAAVTRNVRRPSRLAAATRSPIALLPMTSTRCGVIHSSTESQSAAETKTPSAIASSAVQRQLQLRP